MWRFGVSRALARIVLGAALCGIVSSADAIRLDVEGGTLYLGRGASGDEAMRAAILSIHAFVEKNRRHGPLVNVLDHVEPMPPAKAAQTIAEDSSDLSELHRRRALLRLLAWVPDAEGVKEAVRILVGDVEKADALRDRVLRLTHGRLSGGGACQTEGADLPERVSDLVTEYLGPVSHGSCPSVTRMAASVLRDDNGNIAIPSQVIAEGSLEKARKGLDPQRWKTCSKLWGAAYLVKLNNDGTIADNGNCAQKNSPLCMPAAGDERPIGGTWDTDDESPERPLFEQFVCDQIPCDVRLLLHVRAAVAPGSTTTTLAKRVPDYSLWYDRPRPWKEFPYPTTDHGSVFVTAKDLSGGKTELTVVSSKVFGFPSEGQTSTIYFILENLEMANYLADLVCCDKV